MPFPFKLNGVIEVPVKDSTPEFSTAVIQAIACRIKQARPSSFEISANEIIFSGGVFRLVLSSNLLVPITSGRIKIEPSHLPDLIIVYYQITFTEMFIMVTIMVAGFMAPILLSVPKFNIIQVLAILIIMWLWLFGANFVTTWWRFRRALRKAIKQVT